MHSSKEIVRGKKILVVEDDSISQSAMLEILQKADHDITIAGNGREAVDLVENADFDMIIMDVQMPVMDGIEATRLIREKYRKDEMPIIMVSANTSVEIASQSGAAGANKHLAKPVSPGMLLEVISEYLITSGQVENTVNTGGYGDESDICRFDRSKIESLLEIDVEPANIVKIIMTFFQTSRELMSEIEQAISDNDIEQLKAAAHQLKGASSFVGAVALMNKCDEVKDWQDTSTETHHASWYSQLSEEEKIFNRILNDYYKQNLP